MKCYGCSFVDISGRPGTILDYLVHKLLKSYCLLILSVALHPTLWGRICCLLNLLQLGFPGPPFFFFPFGQVLFVCLFILYLFVCLFVFSFVSISFCSKREVYLLRNQCFFFLSIVIRIANQNVVRHYPCLTCGDSRFSSKAHKLGHHYCHEITLVREMLFTSKTWMAELTLYCKIINISRHQRRL